MKTYNFDQHIDRKGTDSVKWSAYPEDVIPMWVADSDFSAPDAVVEALSERLAHPALGYGSDVIEKGMDNAARHWVQSRFGWSAPAGSSAFAPGVVGAICLAIQEFTRPGENVVTLSPAYPPIIQKPEQNGRNSLSSPMLLDKNGHYSIDFDDLEEKLARRESSMFILCNPHNPTGRVFTREELLKIAELCLANNVLIFSDEIHCDYVHKGAHIPLPSLSPAIAANTIVSINPSKTFNIAGMHSAVIMTENKELLKRYNKHAEAVGLHPNILGANAFTAAYMHCADYADAVKSYVHGNLLFATDFIKREIPRIKAFVPEASYLLWADCREMGLNPEELMNFFLEKAKVAPASGSNYNSLHGTEGDGFIRLNLACPRSNVEAALTRIAKASI